MFTVGKLRKTVLIFIIILIQSALAVTAGIAVLSVSAGDTLPPGLFVGDASIGGMDRGKASKAVEDYFRDILSEGSLEISIADENYEIAYADFDVSVDGSSTLDSMDGWKSAVYVPNLIKAYFGHDRLSVRPVIKYNEGKLRQKLIELSAQINKAPVDASIFVNDGRIVKKPETPGRVLNISSAVEAIGNHLFNAMDSPLVFSGNTDVLQTVAPERMLKEFSDIEQVVAEYTTDITEPEALSSIKLAVDAINGIVLSGSVDSNPENKEFSFVHRLMIADKDFQNDNEGYDQVASTLYAALLLAGIDKDAITRLQHILATEYIEPGLDAWISGNGGDLKFRNTLEHKIALFAAVEDNRLTICLAGNLLDKRKSYELRVETIQKFSPPVVNLENKDLMPGEKVMLSPGKEGLLVQVFRDDEFISEDRYEAEKAMVQVGPGAVLGNEVNK